MPVEGRPGDARGKRGSRPSDSRRRLITDFDALAAAREAEFRRVAMRLFAGEIELIDQLWERLSAQSGGILRPDDPIAQAAIRFVQRAYAPDGLYHKRWLARYADLIGSTVSVGGRNVTASVGLDFSLSNPRVRDAIAGRATELATHVGETSATRVTAVIRDSVDNGLGTRKVAERIRDEAFNADVSLARATRIARTETIGSLATGEHLGAVESGVVETKEWMTVGDERVRESHRDLDGMIIPLNDRFPNGLLHPGEAGQDPGEIINCRCTLLYAA